MDDKQPSDNHDFSDFDDLFAEQGEDFDHGLDMEEEVDDRSTTDDTIANVEPSIESSVASQSDNLIENRDVADLLDDPIDAETADAIDTAAPIDDDASTDSITTQADSNQQSDTVTAETLDEEWGDIVADDDTTEADHADNNAPSSPEPETVETITNVPTPDESAPTVEQHEGELIMSDDDLPDIDFPNDDDEVSQAVDDIIDDLESFDDFVIDDDEPVIASEFSEQAALDPIQQADPQPTVSPQPAEELAELPAPEADDDPWADDAITTTNTAEKPIVPEQQDEVPNQSDQPDPEEEESMKQSNIIALIAGAVALLASMGGLWLGYSAKAELAQLPVQAGSNSVLDDAKLKAMDAKIGQADERLTKLATQLASFGVMSGGSSDPKVDALDTRTARLEQQISDIKEQIGHLRNSFITQKKRPSPVRKVVRSKPKPKPKAKPKPTPRHAPTINRGGRWFVNLTSHSNINSARQQVQQMKKLGITAESKQVVVKGRTYFRVRIAGFATKAKSNAFKAMLANKHHISDSWVSNY